MITDKANMLCILKILQEYSNPDHILSIGDIITKMSQLYDKTVDRRTIYSAIEALSDFGYEISDYSENHKGYYLYEREFSQAEIRLLADAVYSCDYISQRQTKELLEKLKSFLNTYDRQNFGYTEIIKTEKKSPNQEVFLNIDTLVQAIRDKKKISFTYLDYDYDKKLKPRKDKKYIANPYNLICENSRYYLVLISEGHSEPSFYRVDMMKDISILDQNIDISKRDAGLESVEKVVYAHTGKPELIHLKCSKIALRYVIEEFGNDVEIIEKKDGDFEAFFRTAPEGLLYWALQYMQCVEVVEPKSLRKAVKEAIKKNKYN